MIESIIILMGGISNRVRGSSFKYHTEFNLIMFGLCMGYYYQLEWWGYLLFAVSMWLGSASGWSEGIGGCFGEFNLKPSLYNWISKIVKPKDQLTTFLYMCIRGLIWVACIEIAFLLTIGFNYWLLMAIPLFYVSYRVCYYIPISNTRRWELGEIIYGMILWGLCLLGG